MKVFPGTDKEYYMDGYLNENLKTAKEVIKKDWDMIFAVDGSEGSGKSVLAMQIAYFCDPTFNLDRVVFTANSFRKTIIESKPYQAIIYDEAYTGLSSRSTMGLINRTLVGVLAEIRQKNLFIFVVMPTFFDLDKYVALWRSRALIHVYTSTKFQRGFFSFYNVDKKKAMYVLGKKFYSYSRPRPNFYGRFTNHYVVDEAGYRKKKKESLSAREKKREELELKKELENALFDKVMETGEDIKHGIKMKILNMPEGTYWGKLKKWKEEKGI